MTLATHATSLRTALEHAARGLVDREVLVDAIALAAVAGEHVLVIGPPGTAKSEAVRRVARATGGRYFEYLLGRFTEPSEIFGPIDLAKLREGLVEAQTAGMLPEAEIAFLDEVFLGSTAILNTLLAILNERIFRRGHTAKNCPLRVCVAASNRLPEDDSLAAFADRFLVRVFVEPTADPLLEDLLDGGWALSRSEHARADASMADLDALTGAVRDADLSTVRNSLAQAVRLLRKNGIALTDRRAVKVQKLVAAAGVLAGRSSPDGRDLWPVVFAVPTREEQALAREVLRELLAESENSALAAATLDASAAPRARATRIVRAAETLFAEKPADASGAAGWRLRLEGIAREIDAGFAADAMPGEIASLRARVVGELGAG